MSFASTILDAAVEKCFLGYNLVPCVDAIRLMPSWRARCRRIMLEFARSKLLCSAAEVVMHPPNHSDSI